MNDDWPPRNYECCGALRRHSSTAGTRTHEPTCENFKQTATVHVRTSATSTQTLNRAIGEGYTGDSVEVRCSNGNTVNVYADGSVKITNYEGRLVLHSPPA